jgi:hypothetical protein
MAPSSSMDRRTSLTSAVLPVPGRPDIYSVEACFSWPALAAKKDARNSEMVARSVSRPAIAAVLLQVVRSRPRARACRGISAEGGLSGGVEIFNLDMAVAGVVGGKLRAEVDLCRDAEKHTQISTVSGDHWTRKLTSRRACN